MARLGTPSAFFSWPYLILTLNVLTALCSSSSSGNDLDWPANRALPLFPDAAKDIEYVKLTGLAGDEQMLLVSLQGLVNRQRPRLYMSWSQDENNSDDMINEAWLRQIESQGFRSSNTSGSPLQLIERYKPDISGAIVYDTRLPDTINVASTLAGISGAVLATEELAQRFNLSVIEDLRGRFKNKFDLYQYAAESIWPKTTNRLITAIKPVSAVLFANNTWDTLLTTNSSVRDGSNNGTFKIGLTRFVNRRGVVYVNISDAFPGDGYGPSVYRVKLMVDGNRTIADFQPGTEAEDPYLFDDGGSHLADYPGGWRFADGSAAIIYKFEFPHRATRLTLSLSMWNQYQVSATSMQPGYHKENAVFRDYIVATSAPCAWLDSNKPREAALLDTLLSGFQQNAAYLGWFPNGDEMAGVTQLAKHGVYVAATDFYFNPTLFSGVRNSTHAEEAAASETAASETAASEMGTSLSSPGHPPRSPSRQQSPKAVLCLVYLEGDNVQYNQRAMLAHWTDPARGSVPLGWTISPLLRDIGPGILAYYQRTATPNDVLVAGPDGAGYTYPGSWPAEALKKYLEQSGVYMRATKTDRVLFVYDRVNATDTPPSPELAVAFRDAVGRGRLRGLLYGQFVSTAEELQVNVTDGFPVANVVSIGGAEAGAAVLRNISDRWQGSGPVFIAGAVGAFDVSPTAVKSMVEQLGDDFEVVRPDVWFEMLRKKD
ncbi:hypothetical protein C8035_v010371 [Colletotrichum spinosum]|uniref:Uncharacterized protein n=1 Tax=Colletotrichum spinosum TaxID=1347390 RepID=A0A4R8PXL6_9PEZI|nr:hypothetical protein C8035_v010371 [Colletotrichum spinosum]